ncbi:TspO/MBR family protein [Pseudonocardia nematodicida]|uniref:TspO/MBR family protein n=1 Tax=Pseudonocardia nematodicida TaxID=1206997 RepID=A0ABV1KJE7_9PSEU
MATTIRGARAARRVDMVRAWVVLAAAVVQAVAGSLGGSGFFGESQQVLSDRYPSPLMPATIAFSVWTVIYLALLVYAVHQTLPGQPARAVHRATGWWFVATAVFNAGWIVVFSQGYLGTAQVLIVALLVSLVMILRTLARFPAESTVDRVLLHGPMAFYTGWVALATVLGATVTSTYLGAEPGPWVGALVLLVAVAVICGAVFRTVAAVPFAATAAWALFWIAVEAGAVVATVAGLGALAVVAAAALRARQGSRPAFG